MSALLVNRVYPRKTSGRISVKELIMIVRKWDVWHIESVKGEYCGWSALYYNYKNINVYGNSINLCYHNNTLNYFNIAKLEYCEIISLNKILWSYLQTSEDDEYKYYLIKGQIYSQYETIQL